MRRGGDDRVFELSSWLEEGGFVCVGVRSQTW